MAELEHTVRVLVAELGGVDASVIRSDADLRGYGVDSVRAVELLVRLEEAFAVSIPDEALTRLTTISDVVAYVSRLMEGGA